MATSTRTRIGAAFDDTALGHSLRALGNINWYITDIPIGHFKVLDRH